MSGPEGLQDETRRNEALRAEIERAKLRHPGFFGANYDAVVNPADCLHCRGSRLAPSSDGRTECGFCSTSVPPKSPQS